MFRGHCGSAHDERWGAGRHGRGRRFGPFGFGGRDGMGAGDFVRAGRMLAQGDIRLIALSLIAEQPRHGYDIIKALEEKTAGWYSPSPGIVYPTLTYLEEAGYVTAESSAAKRLYAITEEGRAYLAENQEFVDAVLARLSKIGDKIARMRRRLGFDESDERDSLSPLVRGALENIREVTAKRVQESPEQEARVVEILARAADELRRTQ
ncbi:MAG TPA: PadR family transcriptional regulator [Pseudolabrys sp.]|nr:PadR family transcriptional regulator [Pseudolabrys sp.]